jgi:histidyl-tRNA synthetase
VVTNEMYPFEDRGGRSLTLRPEGTAGVMRAVVEHRLLQGQLPVKLWYTGPNFRYEQPQSGRYRQHVQVGIEAVGVDDPALDAEVLAIADEGVRRLGLTDYDLRLTSLGCERCRPAYRELLVRFLDGLDLDEATRARARLNPLRVLDDKRPEVRTQLEGAPLPPEHLCEECAEHFAAVRSLLDDAGVAYDATLGFSSTAGFRAGCCYEFPVFNVVTRRPLRLRERPLVAMEVALLDRLGLAKDELLERLLTLCDRCRLVGGDFTLLWHNSRLQTRADREAYEALVRAAA